MATIKPYKDKTGNVRSYKFIVCVGRDERNKQVWRTTTVPRPEGLTPKKEEKEIARQAQNWEQEQKAEYEREKTRIARERKEKDRILFVDFMEKHWKPKHVNNGKHTPDTVSYYNYEAECLKKYFEEEKPKIKLAQIAKEDVLGQHRAMAEKR